MELQRRKALPWFGGLLVGPTRAAVAEPPLRGFSVRGQLVVWSVDPVSVLSIEQRFDQTLSDFHFRFVPFAQASEFAREVAKPLIENRWEFVEGLRGSSHLARSARYSALSNPLLGLLPRQFRKKATLGGVTPRVTGAHHTA
jgi:hypothetical protein